MSGTITGGCLCGAVRYAHDGPIGAANCCHCEDCRRCTGGPFGISIRMEAARFRILSGSPRGFTKTADSGRSLTRHFCPDCGSPIYTTADQHAGHVYVKAGSLDDPTLVRVDRQAWTDRRVPWAILDPALPGRAKG
jgi:hypothetical protein